MTGYLHLDHINMENMLLLSPSEDWEIEGYDMPSLWRLSDGTTVDLFSAEDIKRAFDLGLQWKDAVETVKLTRRRWRERRAAIDAARNRAA